MVCNDNGIINGTECRESDGTVFRLALTDYDPEGNPVSGTYTSDGYLMKFGKWSFPSAI